MPDYGYKFSMDMTLHDTISILSWVCFGTRDNLNRFNIYIEYMDD